MVHPGHPTQIAVEYILVVVVDRLEHTVAHPEGPSEACYLGPRRVECLPEPVVELMDADGPPVHGTQHLDVPHGMKSKSRRDPLRTDADHGVGRRLRFSRFDEIEVLQGFSGGKGGQPPLVDPMGRLDDAAPVSLTENPLKTQERYNSGLKNVPKELARPDGGQLVGISHEQHRGGAGHGLQQVVAQHDVQHRGLVDHHGIGLQGPLAVPSVPALPGLELQQTVQRLSIAASSLAQTLGRPPGGGRQCHPLAKSLKDQYHGAQDGCLAGSRPARQDEDLLRYGL